MDTQPSRWDVIVHDAEPLLSCPATLELVRQAHACLYVVRADSTPRSIVQEATSAMRSAAKCPVGLVLNGTHFHVPSCFGADD